MSTKKPHLLNILRETSHIITTHPRHFLTLSLLFIFPSSISAIFYTFLSQPPSLHHLPIQITFLLSTYLFSLCAVSSITYTAFRRKPLSLVTSLKSIPPSFFPLLATAVAVQIVICFIIFVFTVLAMVLSSNGVALYGFEMDYDDPYFLVFAFLMASLLIGVTISLQVEWYLLRPLVVLESRWGFSPLIRSCRLVKGMRGVIFMVTTLVAIPSWVLFVWFISVVANVRGVDGGLTAWLVLKVVVYAGLSVVVSLYGLVANTVVFVHCKALNDESTFQVDDKPSVVYAQLPSDVI